MPGKFETIFWFRRDLRLADNHGLFEAARRGLTVRPLFIFDTDILDRLPRADARVEFILEAVGKLHRDLKTLGGGLTVRVGRPRDVFAKLLAQHKISAVHINEDYEPYAVKRDADLEKLLRKNRVPLIRTPDQMVFAPTEILKDDGTPYRVYGAYARRWRAKFATAAPRAFASRPRLAAAGVTNGDGPPGLNELGFEPTAVPRPSATPPRRIIASYGDTRDFMGETSGTSRMGPHLRFGTVSPRRLATMSQTSDIYFGELIWREFFMQIFAHFPRTATEDYDVRFKRVAWRQNRADFKRWCEGKTGYPIVDAGMRQLNQTGFMHNRARMITGSFLCKHLLIDWRWGEAYFAEKLLDYERSSNVGNWQWVAGCGCDAAPYFRVFSPERQAKRFDPGGRYVARWVPELGTSAYPEPMVPHEFARRRALGTLSAALRGASA